jgi:hypothetical protein
MGVEVAIWAARQAERPVDVEGEWFRVRRHFEEPFHQSRDAVVVGYRGNAAVLAFCGCITLTRRKG